MHKVDVLPPESLASEFTYSPMPAEFIPPIGPNYLKHIFHNPEDANDLPVCLTKMPKKLRQQLAACPIKGVSSGWGISLIEGVSWLKVCIAAFTACAASPALGTSWSVMRNDIQGGFGVASFALTMFATGM